MSTKLYSHSFGGGAGQRLQRNSLFVLAAVLLTVAIGAPLLAQPQERQALAPVTGQGSPAVIRGQYIVVFKKGTSRATVLAVEERVKALGGKVLYKYDLALVGLAIALPDAAPRSQPILQMLRDAPSVEYIEAAKKYSWNTVQPPSPSSPAPWGLDRIDRRLLPVNGAYTYDASGENGTGVRVYVVDSGVSISHDEFQPGRALSGVGVTGTSADCNGHGTHVAGIIGGNNYGVAKGVTLVPVSVADSTCTATEPTILWGINQVLLDRNANAPGATVVANISIGGPFSVPINSAIANSVAQNVVYVVAAGNDNDDACNYSPSSEPSAITVGATQPNDSRAGFSNWGHCLNLFAPGVDVISAMPDGLLPLPNCFVASNTPGRRSQVCSGTSMAAPHVSGIAARYLQQHAGSSPGGVWNAIHNAANVATTPGWGGVLAHGAGSPNELLHWGAVGEGTSDDPSTGDWPVAVPSLPACKAPGDVVTIDLSTGTDLSGASVGNGAFDRKWVVESAPPAAAALATPAAPTYAHTLTGFWVPATAPTSWIIPWPNAQTAGLYRYRLTFDVPNAPSSYSPITITGTCNSDDTGTVKLNGNLLPLVGGGCGFPAGTAGTFSSSNPLFFQQGANNHLDIEVNNAGSATGLLVNAKIRAVCGQPAATATLKVCKVAGFGVTPNTPFSFSTSSPAHVVSVPAGPAPGGNCTILGTDYVAGTPVTIQETGPAGYDVTGIAASAPIVPNLPGKSALVTPSAGVTQVTFANRKHGETGYLEICKKEYPLVSGEFTFMVNPGGIGPIKVPAGACSPAFMVPSGNVVITELPRSGYKLIGASTLQSGRQGAWSSNGPGQGGSSTVVVPPGNIASETTAFITNKKILFGPGEPGSAENASQGPKN